MGFAIAARQEISRAADAIRVAAKIVEGAPVAERIPNGVAVSKLDRKAFDGVRHALNEGIGNIKLGTQYAAQSGNRIGVLQLKNAENAALGDWSPLQAAFRTMEQPGATFAAQPYLGERLATLARNLDEVANEAQSARSIPVNTDTAVLLR